MNVILNHRLIGIRVGYSYTQQSGYKDWIRFYAKRNWFSIAILLVLAIIGVGISLIAPLPIQILIDNIFGDTPLPSYITQLNFDYVQLLTAVVAAYALIRLLGSFLQFLQSYVQIKSNQKIDKSAMEEEFNAVSRIPYNDVVRGDPMDNIYEVTTQSQLLSSYILDNSVSIIQSILLLIGALVTLYFIDPFLLIIVAITLPILAISTVKFGKRIETSAQDTETAHSRIYTFVSESLEKLRTIQAFAYVRKRLSVLSDMIVHRNKYATRQLVVAESYTLVNDLVIIAAMTGALIVGVVGVDNGTMTLGFLVVALTYMELAFSQVSVVADVFGSISAQRATIKQAFEPIDRARLFIPSGSTNPIKGNIEFRDVTLKKGTKEVFVNLNISIPSGSVIGVVGKSGSGKTTFIDSLLRFNDVHGGQILIDNENIQSYDIDWLRSNISLVEQEPDLFDGTINENISLAEPTREFNLLDIMAAGDVAKLSEYLEEKSDNKDLVIDNYSMSGGQKQRIAIARAFYKRAPIMILDEPTSALDPSVGHEVIDNILAYSKGRTVIIITHDLSLLKKLPYIFVAGDGKIQDINQLGGVDKYFNDNAHLLT